MNRLAELAKYGQSVWFDQMQRSLVSSGELAKMIAEDDLRGLTSNPTIFEKAIAGSADYAGQLTELALAGQSRDSIYEAIVVDDIAHAADVFRPVYDKTKGVDGFVSLEVSPNLAHDTAGTIAEALRLFEALNRRPNVMIKVPATPEGIPAIEELIAQGLNINVTLIFGQKVYAEVIEAYIRGLERRAEKGQPIDGISSVASFFVSRIDTLVDKQIEAKIASASDDATKAELQSLVGKVAIANAKAAYALFRERFEDGRFKKLGDKGAKVQRPLWASTGTKNPKLSDVLYVETLIGPNTVNTVPPATYAAFRDHGNSAATLEKDLDGAKDVLARLEKAGISLQAATEQLTAEGVKSFAASFTSLMKTLDDRIAEATSKGGSATKSASKGQATADRITGEKFVPRIWAKDASLWKSGDDHKKIIDNALGWLNVAEMVLGRMDELNGFVDAARKEFDDVVVLGMGGSSLCPEVLRRSFGRKEGYPELHVLDSTVPAAVRELESQLVPEKTLFIVASKSGSTTEPQMFYRYFFDKLKTLKGDRGAENFIAITDPNTQLEGEAKRDKFRKIFVNPADIGGRYSALSFFGMVPAALAGIDVKTFLERAVEAMKDCKKESLTDNPGVELGARIGTLALEGRDKLTFVTPAPIDSLGLWIEQLIAESTGKEGRGIIPIAGETLAGPDSYGKDRIFVLIRTASSDAADLKKKLDALAAAGHPVIEHVLRDTLDLGREFFVWEFATAVAGAVIGINPFDQPNVQESKDNTKRLIEEFRANGAFEEQQLLAKEGQLQIFGAGKGNGAPSKSPGEVVAEQLGKVRPGDYVALTQYFVETGKADELLDEIRSEISSKLQVATTTGYGPRFLHSTGQLHKGGGDNGVFIQITADDNQDIPIPGEPFSFGILKQAQALGDFQSLASRNRRAIRFHVGSDVEGGLRQLLDFVRKGVSTVK